MAFIFLDESGDLGFSKKRSSKYFIITVLATENKRVIEKVVKAVHSGLHKKIKRLSGGILHAYKEKPTTRNRLLSLLSEKECFVMVIYLNKAKVYTKLKEEKHVLYNYVTNILLDRILSKKLIKLDSIVNLIASRHETNKFLNDNFRDYIEKEISNRHRLKINIEVKSPSVEKSLQAVDFVSWAIFRKYEFDDDSYYNLIKGRITEENALFP